jgi:rfaE bifunctional protein nucleotidyltransferase chain/domain/rfaE bifunctional protein kinase chain/domain
VAASIGQTSLPDLADRWAGREVLVVGDVMLDEWRLARASRLCREAPAPVLSLRRRTEAAGGAGNAAANLAGLGARPVLVAPVGGDAAGRRLRSRLAGAGVADRTVTVAGRATPVKRRLVAEDQIVVREDAGEGALPLPERVSRRLAAAMEAVVREASEPVLVVCDHGLGALDGPVREWLVAHRGRFSTVAVDAHDLCGWAGLAPSLVTPSVAEAVRALGMAPDGDRAEAAAACLPGLARLTGAGLVAVTMDRDGAVVAGRDGRVHRTHADPAPASHAVGAGDAYLAAATLAVSAGASAAQTAGCAQLAATLSLSAGDTCVCRRDRLLGAAAPGAAAAPTGVVDAAGLARVIREHRRRGARVVFTNGCFDVLHRGHVTCLEQAGQLGDVLVVAVNSDAGVRRLKGPERPVNRVEDRVAVLAALSCVDLVVVFDEESPTALIELVRPDVYVKGGDYPPELVPEGALVRRLGGRVHIVGYVPDRSTSAVIERIRARHAGTPAGPNPASGPA